MKTFYIQRKPLTRLTKAIDRGEVTIGFLGGSITDPRGRCRWSEYVTYELMAKYPGVRFNIENIAIGATGSLSALFRMERCLPLEKCDLVFVEYAVNDRLIDPDVRFRAREGVLRKLLAADCDVICTYTFMREMLEHLNKGVQPPTISEFEQLTEHYGIPSVFMGDYALEQLRLGLVRWEEWLPDGLHPSHCGSRFYAKPVCDLLYEEISARREGEPVSLTEPLRPDHWASAYELDFDEVRTKGPWLRRNLLGFPSFDHCLYTGSNDASLEFDFEGVGLAITVNFGKQCSDFELQLDDGPWEKKLFSRPDWISDLGWTRTELLLNNLPAGRHTVRLRTVLDHESTATGSVFEICNFGILI